MQDSLMLRGNDELLPAILKDYRIVDLVRDSRLCDKGSCFRIAGECQSCSAAILYLSKKEEY